MRAGNFWGIKIDPGGRFHAIGQTVKGLLTYAYGIKEFQISGGPAWINSERFDIEANAEEDSVPPTAGPRDPNVPTPMQLRVRSLLEDQFQLKSHNKTEEMSAYEITVAKNGLKLTPVEPKPDAARGDTAGPPPPLGKDGLPPPPPPGQSYVFRTTTGFLLRGTAIPLSDLAGGLSWQLSRPVVDHTNVPKSALYDIRLEWSDNGPAPDPFGREDSSTSSDPSGPSIFTAIQDQLGLRLVSTKTGINVIAIDDIEKPKP